jgi:two-component system, NarL family, invasion response regulator UvrY
MKKILLADDHSIVRSGMKALIRDNLYTLHIDEAGTEEEIVKFIKAYHYDLILLDIILPNTDFVQLMQWIAATDPQLQVLIFTMHQEDLYGIRSLQLGAKGYLHKSVSNEEILVAIKRVLNGQKYISPRLAELLSQKPAEAKSMNPFDSLSLRELEIVVQLNNGKSLPEICDILKIQYSTANTYKRRIFDKLNVNNILSLSRLMQSFNM